VQHVVLTQQFVSDLQSARFTNITVEPNHPLVSADGTVAQANAAFNPTIEQFRQFGARVIGNTSAAQVPVTLGSLVASVLGRNNTIGKMQPALVTRTQAAIPTCDFSYNPPGFRKLYGATTVPKASDASNASNAIIAASDLGFAPLRLYRLYKPSPAGITKRASARSRSSSCIAT
jgi:pseudomonalisin/xanthomonalisin